ncbi:MAG: FAD synthetase [Rikenellaceae bacterium]
MQIFKGIESITGFGATVITVGSFDGVHKGHSSLLELLTARAKATGHKSVVVSFSPHPRVTLGRAEGLQLLTSDREKAQFLENQGVDALLLLEFNDAFSALSYREFLLDYLQAQAGMEEIIVGFNNHMGSDAGSYDDLVLLAQENNFEVTLFEEFIQQGEAISSTLIRSLLSKGEIESANNLLSHPYLIIGEADEKGRVHLEEPLKLLPPAGIYSALVNHREEYVTIDSEKRVKCEQKNSTVKIKLLSKNEK